MIYDSEGYEYPIDEYGQNYVPHQAKLVDAMVIEEERNKNLKRSYACGSC